METVIDEGRTFLRRDRSTYDIIQATVVYGRLAPSAGAFTFTEDHLYTREAFRDYLARLAPEGMLSFSRFVYEKRILRLVATARAALEAGGAAAPWAHVFIAAERGLANVIVKRDPFTVGEVALLERRCRELGFDVLHSPAREGEGPLAGAPARPRADEFLAALPFDASPVDDDRPFFYYLLRPADFFRAGSRSGAGLRRPRPPADAQPPRDRRCSWSCSASSCRSRAAAGPGRSAGARPGGRGLLRRDRPRLHRRRDRAAQALPAPARQAGLHARRDPRRLPRSPAPLGSARAGRLAGRAGLLRRRCGVLAIVLMLVGGAPPRAPRGAARRAALGAPRRDRRRDGAPRLPHGRSRSRPGLALLRDERLVPGSGASTAALSVLGSVAALALAVNFGYTVTMLVGPACYLVAGALAELLE